MFLNHFWNFDWVGFLFPSINFLFLFILSQIMVFISNQRGQQYMIVVHRAYQIHRRPIFRHKETLIVSLRELKIISLVVIGVWESISINIEKLLRSHKYCSLQVSWVLLYLSPHPMACRSYICRQNGLKPIQDIKHSYYLVWKDLEIVIYYEIVYNEQWNHMASQMCMYEYVIYGMDGRIDVPLKINLRLVTTAQIQM
jgi:hypothetical protein